MRLKIINSKNEIQNLDSDERLVHLAFRANNVDLLNLMQKCPRLRVIQVQSSCKKTMSDSIKVFLDMQGIELLEGDIWDHIKCLDEYFTIDDSTLDEIRTSVADGASIDDVAKQIQEKCELGWDLIKYIAKTKIIA